MSAPSRRPAWSRKLRKRAPGRRAGGARPAPGPTGRPAERTPRFRSVLDDPGEWEDGEPIESGTDQPGERKPRFYRELLARDDRELAWLADPSLAQEMGMLRIRLQERLADPRADWRLTLRSLEVLERMSRTQWALTPEEDEGAALEKFRDVIHQVFGRDPDEEGRERRRPEPVGDDDLGGFTPIALG